MPELHPELPSIRLALPGPGGAQNLLEREWLVTNGLGGYASGTVGGVNTRRYHGLFIPVLPPPRGRTVMLPRLEEHVRVAGSTYRLDGEERTDGTLLWDEGRTLRAFELRGLLPRWEHQLGPARLQRRLVLPHAESSLFLEYRLLEGPPITLRLRPYVTFRFHDRPLPPEGPLPVVLLQGARVEITAREDASPLRLRVFSPCPAPFVSLLEHSQELLYRVERARGLDCAERQVSPGYFECALEAGQALTLAATSGDWEQLDREPAETFELELTRQARLLQQAPPLARAGTPARLVLAADQFVIEPVSRPQDEAWARATGQDARSVIAGYHWFTDWGRDTMISLEGLTLSTGRFRSAAAILRTFQHYVRDGLLPNLFPEGGREGLYHTADATLWFFHAIDRYVELTGDLQLVRDLFPTLQEIVSRHLAGTRFGIGIDARDGLLTQGAEGYQLTWMDAKVDGWVVTPRRGKAVELSALWFNALRLMAEWSERLGHPPAQYLRDAERTQVSFNQRFWNARERCLFDVVDGEAGDDPAIRPNQIFSLSLRHPVLARDRWGAVLDRVREQLLTPVGLRSLAPGHPDYRATYDGDLRARDAAYHQGTVWAWLIGHYVNAALKVNPDRAEARKLLLGLEGHLLDKGVGQVSEIFDAGPPFRDRGCIAQAWSVAELLRAWLATEA